MSEEKRSCSGILIEQGREFLGTREFPYLAANQHARKNYRTTNEILDDNSNQLIWTCRRVIKVCFYDSTFADL